MRSVMCLLRDLLCLEDEASDLCKRRSSHALDHGVSYMPFLACGRAECGCLNLRFVKF